MIATSLSKLLCCSQCKADLVQTDKLLSCKTCRKDYHVQNGIPVLIDLDNLPPHLQGQVKFFENEKITERAYGLEDWQKSYLRRFEENWPNVEGKTVIDCGTGSGYMAIELAKKGAFVIACDLTMRSLVRLSKVAQDMGLSDRVLCVCCTSEELPFISETADFFISNAVLEHLPKEKEAISEIKRVMRKNSQLMITVPLAYRFINPLLLPLNYVHDKRIGHLRRYDEVSLRNHFNELRLEKTYYTGHSAKVFKTVINFFGPIFSTEKMEEVDRLSESNKWWASNIMCFFNRGKNF